MLTAKSTSWCLPHWPLGVMSMQTLGGFYNLPHGRFLAILPLMLLRRGKHPFPLPAGFPCTATTTDSHYP